MGVVPAAEGDVRFAGRSIRGRAPEAIARAGISLVPEGRRIFGELSVEENLQLGLAARRRNGGSDPLCAGGVRALSDARRVPGPPGGRALRRPAAAAGDRAGARARGPDLLLLDEPSLGLSPTVVDAVFAALAAIRDRGVTVLLVEQRAQRTVALADRTLVLANGELRMTLTPADADDTEKMIRAYLA